MSPSRRSLSALCTLPLLVLTGATNLQARAGGIPICHHAGPTHTVDIQVAPEAVFTHIINHGDTIGTCGGGTT
jgi:hypothetical protein